MTQYPDTILDYEDLGLIKNGKPRLAYAQAYFTRQGTKLSDYGVKKLLIGLYSHWRDLPEYLVFEGEISILMLKSGVLALCLNVGTRSIV
ncbi:unnamed protein product, partial [marine sediment metagenome]